MFAAITLLLLALSATSASPLNQLQARGGTPSSEGFHDGFYYNYWTDGGANATYTNLAGGSFSLDWGSGGNLIGGKGWRGDTFDRVITYSANYSYSGVSYLAANGWVTDPQADYYIVENYSTFNPITGARVIGTLDIDGSTYDLAESTRSVWLPFPGQVLYTYWSVRRDKRTSGTIDVGAHIKAWRGLVKRFGSTNYYTVMACEGYYSTGSCTVDVSISDAATPDGKL